MDKILKAPMKYIQGRGILHHLSDYINQGYVRIVIIADDFVIQNMKDQLLHSFDDEEIILLSVPNVCSKKKLNELIKDYTINVLDLIVGIGGGKTMDVAKGLSYYTDSDVIVVPSVASTDAPCSSIAVLYHDDLTFDTYLHLKRSPSAVLVDEDVIVKAPLRLFIAGIGDALSTYIEARACYEARKTTDAGGTVTYSALMIAKACYESVMEYALSAVDDVKHGIVSDAVENIIETNILLSGIGFESGGLSIAHTLHNALTKVKSNKQNMHGEVVAYATLVQLACEGNKQMFEEVYQLCTQIGLPTTLQALGIEVNKEIMKQVENECFEKLTNIHNVPYEMDMDKLENAIRFVESCKEANHE